VNVLLNLFLIPVLGILGAALSTFISYALGSFLLRRSWQDHFSLTIPWNLIAKSTGAAVLMALIIFLLRPTGLLLTITMVPFGIILYGTFLVLFGVFDRSEILFLRSILRKLS